MKEYNPADQQDPDYVDNFARLLKENITRFLGVPKSIHPPQECDEPAS